MHIPHLWHLLGIFGTLLISAYLSTMETALLSVPKVKMTQMVEKGSRVNRVLTLWLDHPNRVLSSILIGNNFSNITFSILSEDFVAKTFGKSSVLLISIVLTIIVALFAEIIPKTFARDHAKKLIVPTITIFQFFYIFLFPLAAILNKISDGVHSLFVKNKTADPQITEEDLEFLINIGEREGTIAEQKHEMLSGIFEMGETLVREIMVPRTDITALPVNTSLLDAIDRFKETGLSRIPLYEDRIDNIVGSVHVKDVLFRIKKMVDAPDQQQQGSLADIRRDVIFVPETKTVDQLFQEMRKGKLHLAIVLDEYGGTSGIVTMEDIFEEIVGEVRDEFDNEEDMIKLLPSEHDFLIDCRIHIDDFCDFFSLDTEKFLREARVETHDFDTLAGFILHKIGHIPKAKESFEILNLTFTVAEVSKRRIRKVIVKEKKTYEK